MARAHYSWHLIVLIKLKKVVLIAQDGASDFISYTKHDWSGYNLNSQNIHNIMLYLFFICFVEILLLHDPLIWPKAWVGRSQTLLHLIQRTCEVWEPIHLLTARPAENRPYQGSTVAGKTLLLLLVYKSQNGQVFSRPALYLIWHQNLRPSPSSSKQNAYIRLAGFLSGFGQGGGGK